MPHFSPALFKFLRNLAANNNREWFQANKARYQEVLQQPALTFISDFAPRLANLSKHFVADPRPVGGSLFRIYRDTRFSKDKSPYKTNTGIHFRHEAAKDAHAPGFYLHLEPGQCFVGVGLWHPDSGTAGQIRQSIVDRSAVWKRSTRRKAFTTVFTLAGDSLKRPPRGFDPDHPLLEDLKRKDFIATVKLSQKEIVAPGLIKQVTNTFRAGAPMMRFLCQAVGVPY
ncbi:MAG: DUF2461 domain-containing protein [Deltaproteobacteria bacterium]|nr:DUF2461 domain-containing protein [Deltaproteobacteria bacterium]